jgi:hypothetical protein
MELKKNLTERELDSSDVSPIPLEKKHIPDGRRISKEDNKSDNDRAKTPAEHLEAIDDDIQDEEA